MPGVVRSLTRLLFSCFRVFTSTFYALLTETNNLLLTFLAGFDHMGLGLMVGSPLRLVAFHLLLSKPLCFCSISHIRPSERLSRLYR